MDYEYIKKLLGEKWLEEQLSPSNKDIRIAKGINREDVNWMIDYTFMIINGLIAKHANLKGFKSWLKEAKRSKNFKDCLFELICFDELTKCNELIIKQANFDKKPDAFLKNMEIYIEMTNLQDIPVNLNSKANDLYMKSLDKFNKANGLHFICVNQFYEYNPRFGKLTPKSQLRDFVEELGEQLKHAPKSFLGFVPIHNYFQYNQKNQTFGMLREIPFFIFTGNKVNLDLIKSIIGNFKIIDYKKINETTDRAK